MEKWTLMWDGEVPSHGGQTVVTLYSYNNKRLMHLSTDFPSIRKGKEIIPVRLVKYSVMYIMCA